MREPTLAEIMDVIDKDMRHYEWLVTKYDDNDIYKHKAECYRCVMRRLEAESDRRMRRVMKNEWNKEVLP